MRVRLESLAMLVVLTFSSAALAAPAPAKRPADPLPQALEVLEKSERVFEDLAKRVRPAVVNVLPYSRVDTSRTAPRPLGADPIGWRVGNPADQQFPGYRPGHGASGFVVSADGYILTLRRVVVNATSGKEADLVGVEVMGADGGFEHYKAAVVSLEPTLDLAILKIERPEPFAYLRFGDSGKSQPGHWAIAFGNPDGTEQTLVPGFVAVQPSRECYQDDLSATYMQTSAMVSDGALGGPVVNLQGEVIAISARRGKPGFPDTAGDVPGSAYALPSNIVNAVYQAMLIRESKESPWLGISVLQLNDTLRKKLGDPRLTGIYIDNVFDPSPASGVGIRVGDVLKSMEGQPIANVYDFQRLLYHAGAGAIAKVVIVREKKSLELTVKIGRRPPEATTR